MATTTPADIRAKLDKKRNQLSILFAKRSKAEAALYKTRQTIEKKKAEISSLRKKLVDLQG